VKFIVSFANQDVLISTENTTGSFNCEMRHSAQCSSILNSRFAASIRGSRQAVLGPSRPLDLV